MNWFNDMLMLFGEWVLLMIIPLLIGIWIGWLLWHKKLADCREENKKLKAESRPEDKAELFRKKLENIGKGAGLDYTDDLKLISGVGPKMEKLLHDYGVTTFYQLSKLGSDDVDALNDMLKFFPGRIKQDNWVGQANKLHKKLHGK